MEFRSLKNGKPIKSDLIQYCIEHSKDCSVYIGTDSQNNRKFTAYVTCIAFRNNKRGAHVIYASKYIPKIRDRFSRLWKETEDSLDIATRLRNAGVLVDAIELDFNKNKNTGSHNMIAPSVGYITGQGFVALTKPEELIACKAADHILRK